MLITKIAITLFFLFSPFPALIYCQDHGLKYIRNFDSVKLELLPQNWAVLQDKRGFIYVGNHVALAEYDGVSWRTIEIPNWSVLSMAIDEEGTIYAGGNNELGFLAPDEAGTLVYQSLLQHIPSEKQDFLSIWGTYCIKGNVYFCTSRFLFVWNPTVGTMKILDTPLKFDNYFKCDGNLFVHQLTLGLQEIVDGSLKLTPNGAAMKNMKIYFMGQFKSGTYLLGTRQKGFYLYDYRGGGTLTPFPTEADEYIKKNRLYHGTRLSHTPGTFALATLRGGLVIIDDNGGIKDIFTKSNGLQDNHVWFVFEDNLGNLWLGLNEGVSRIEYAPSPISYYDKSSGLTGILLAGLRDPGGKDFYVGTTSGLFVTAPPQAAEPYTVGKKFIPVNGISSACFSLLADGDKVLAATKDGLFQLDTRGRSTARLSRLSSLALLHSRSDKNRLWVGTGSGLQSFYLTGGVSPGLRKPEHTFENINLAVRSMVEDEKGTLWLGIPGQGVIRVDFPAPGTIDNPGITQYDENHGLPPGEVSVFFAAGGVRFGTEKGLYAFDEKTGKFRSDLLMGDSFADGSRNVFRLAEDHRHHLWFHSGELNHHAVPRADGSFLIESGAFLRIPKTQVNEIYPDGDIIWFIANNSLIRYDSRIKPAAPVEFPTFIRQLKARDQVVFNGYDQHKFAPVLRFEQRNIRFTYASLFFQEESKTRYAYFLEGYDDQWSKWSLESQKDYTNLDAGSYLFRVKAKNIYGDVSRESQFQFEVLPPWYRTWWSYGSYILLAGLLLFLIIRWRSANLVREKQRLEEVVKARTVEIKAKNKQLQDQSEQLKEMDKVKSRFFANISHEFRTPLTLIMGPLEEKLADSSHDKKQQKEFKMMLRNSRRLLNLVNQLLDLSRFDGGKMELQASVQDIVPFFKGIVNAFDSLALQNGLTLNVHAPERELILLYDAAKLEHAILNLMINAVKYTPSGGKISVNLKRVSGHQVNSQPGHQVNSQPGLRVEICVRDTGIGIAPGQLDHIFERFYQAEGPNQLENKGSGIGLALTKEIVKLHNGEITVHSELGKGSEFIISLPGLPEGVMAGVPGFRAELESGVQMDDKPDIPTGVRDMLDAITPREEDDEERSESPDSDAGKNIILLVEDNADVRSYIRGPLRSLYRVEEAVNGAEGIQKARQIIPDLIISDIMMPGTDGYELCKALKNDVRTSHIPIILLTAKASEESIVEGFETRADDYVTKPFNTKILIARIDSLIDTRRRLQERYQREIMREPAEIQVSSVDREFIKDLQKAVETNLGDPDFTINRLADLLYMSRATLNRKIRALTGEPANRYIQIYRLKRGAQLLKGNFGNVTQVAFEVGFSSAPYFSKRFREIFHQSPQSYQAAEFPEPGVRADD